MPKRRFFFEYRTKIVDSFCSKTRGYTGQGKKMIESGQVARSPSSYEVTLHSPELEELSKCSALLPISMRCNHSSLSNFLSHFAAKVFIFISRNEPGTGAFTCLIF